MPTDVALYTPTEGLPALPVADIEAAKTYIAEQLAGSTRRAYRADVEIFVAYCTERGVSALPAAPESVCTFLAIEAGKGAKYATIARRAAAINFAHGAAGLDSPTRSHIVTCCLKGIRRSIGTAQAKKAPATSNRITAMAGCCPDTLIGMRDRALLLLGFAGAFRRSELAALTVADISEEAAGLRVTIRRSKTDQDGAGQVVAIARGSRSCPVAALKAWLDVAGITEGALFRPIAKGGRIQREAITPKSVALIVKAYAKAAGLDPANFAGHSLRAGLVTSAAEHGASLVKIAEISRHRSLDVLRGYIRSAELFHDHAATGLL